MLTTHGRPGPAESREPGTAKLNFPTRVRYALDAAKGMVFLHQHDIIHHDLKSSNLLVASDKLRTVKICDFSLSDLFSQSVASGDDHFHDEESGTLGWIAPEKMGSGLVTKKVDVYSFAMILWELLHAAKPFEDELFGDNVSDAMRKIRMVDLLNACSVAPLCKPCCSLSTSCVWSPAHSSRAVWPLASISSRLRGGPSLLSRCLSY